MAQYKCTCKLRDPKDKPFYVAALDKYFCDERCWDAFRKRPE